MIDITKQENKKYVPIATFVLGVVVGGVIMHFWIQKKTGGSKEFAAGGTIAPAPPATIQIVQPAPVAPIQTPIMSAPSMAPSMAATGSEVFSTPSMKKPSINCVIARSPIDLLHSKP